MNRVTELWAWWALHWRQEVVYLLAPGKGVKKKSSTNVRRGTFRWWWYMGAPPYPPHPVEELKRETVIKLCPRVTQLATWGPTREDIETQPQNQELNRVTSQIRDWVCQMITSGRDCRTDNTPSGSNLQTAKLIKRKPGKGTEGGEKGGRGVGRERERERKREEALPLTIL